MEIRSKAYEEMAKYIFLEALGSYKKIPTEQKAEKSKR